MYQCQAIFTPHNVNFDPREGKYLFDMYGKVNAWRDYLISQKCTHITRPSVGLPPHFIQHTTQTTDTAPNQQDDILSTLSDAKQGTNSIIADIVNQESMIQDSLLDTSSHVGPSNKKPQSNGNNTSNDNSDNNNNSHMTPNPNLAPL